MKRFLAIGLILCSSFVYADNDVAKAFGQKLRYHYDEAKDVFVDIPFTPADDQKFKLFTDYTISITPKTNKIYSITGSGPLYTTCNQDVVIMNKFLNRKYEFKKVKTDLAEVVNYKNNKGKDVSDKKFIIVYTLVSTDIYLTCEPEENKLSISYVDNDMALTAREEESDLFVKSIDKNIKELEKDENFNIKGL